MTADFNQRAGGAYWPSDWPVAGRANHRPNTVAGAGFNLRPTDHLVTTTRPLADRPVMTVKRDRGQLYLLGSSAGHAATAWVERIGQHTLAPIDRSDDLATGGHSWPGALAAHANGDLYVVAGSFVHRLAVDCRTVAEVELPVDRAHNGLLVLSDGSLVVRDARLGSEPSTLTVLGPTLEVLDHRTLPEPSLGRPASVPDGEGGGDHIYVVGSTRVNRYHWDGQRLNLDPSWQPPYRTPDRGGMAADPTIVGDRLWIHDNASIGGIEALLSPGAEPTEGDSSPGDEIGPADQRAPWPEPVRLMGLRLVGSEQAATSEAEPAIVIEPSQLPGGWALGPPLVDGGIAVGSDTGNTGLTAFDISPGPAAEIRGEMLWFQPFRSSMPPLLFPESGELVVDDFRYLEDGTTSDDLVVLDLASGRMKARVETGATGFGLAFVTPGWGRDIYYCGPGIVARIEALEP